MCEPTLNFPLTRPDSTPLQNGDQYVGNGGVIYTYENGVWTGVNPVVSYGFTGSQGAMGYAGSQGSSGSIGFTGSQGYCGSLGYTGSQGFCGSVGFTGSTGACGSQGYVGSQGYDGSAGFTGSAGAIGFVGSAGTDGYTGSAGTNGYTGSTGAGFTGSSGTNGYTGSAGTSGSNGYTGSAGTSGSNGYTGSAGTNGSNGYTGSAGTSGSNGYTGSAGAKGDTGPGALSSLNYVQVLGNTSSPPVISAGGTILSLTITTTGGPVELVGSGDAVNSSSAFFGTVRWYRGATALGNPQFFESSAANENQSVTQVFIDNPAAGTYTYYWKMPSGNPTITWGESTAPVISATELQGVQGSAGYTGSAGTSGIANLNNLATSISFSNTGVNPPSFVNTSTGVKISYYQQESTSTVDYATGIEPGGLWTSIPSATSNYAFKWYGGTSTLATLTGTGTFITNTLNISNQITTPAGSNANLVLNPDGLADVIVTTSTQIIMYATNTSTSTTTGALVVTGGVGVGGTVTANKFVGDGSSLTNITVTQQANIVGQQQNVTLIAGNYSYIFDNTGSFTMPYNGDIVMTGTNANMTVGGNVGIGGITTMTYSGSVGSVLQINGADTKGGAGYHDFMSVSNTAISTGTNKFFRLDPTGSLQIINSAYSTTLFSLTDAGNLGINGSITMPNRPAFRVYGAGTTNNLGTNVNGSGILNGNNFAVDYQQGTALSTSTGVFTAPVAGLYSVHLVARVTSNSAGQSQVTVIKNNGLGSQANQAMWETGPNPSINHFGASTISKLAAGDTLVLKVTLGSINFDANDSWAVAYIG